jgi:hypothetical protein
MKVIEDRLLLQTKKEKEMKIDYSELYEQYDDAYNKLHAAELDRNDAYDYWQSLLDKWDASKDLFTECSNLLQLIQKDIDGPDKDELSDVENKNENSTANKQLKKEWKVQTRLEQFFAKNKAKALELGVIEPRERQESQPGEFSLLPYMDLCSSVLKGHPVDDRMQSPAHTNGLEGIVIEDAQSSTKDLSALYPAGYFPRNGSLDDLIASVPKDQRAKERKKWKESISRMIRKHQRLHKKAPIFLDA